MGRSRFMDTLLLVFVIATSAIAYTLTTSNANANKAKENSIFHFDPKGQFDLFFNTKTGDAMFHSSLPISKATVTITGNEVGTKDPVVPQVVNQFITRVETVDTVYQQLHPLMKVTALKAKPIGSVLPIAHESLANKPLNPEK